MFLWNLFLIWKKCYLIHQWWRNADGRTELMPCWLSATSNFWNFSEIQLHSVFFLFDILCYLLSWFNVFIVRSGILVLFLGVMFLQWWSCINMSGHMKVSLWYNIIATSEQSYRSIVCVFFYLTLLQAEEVYVLLLFQDSTFDYCLIDCWYFIKFLCWTEFSCSLQYAVPEPFQPGIVDCNLYLSWFLLYYAIQHCIFIPKRRSNTYTNTNVDLVKQNLLCWSSCSASLDCFICVT